MVPGVKSSHSKNKAPASKGMVIAPRDRFVTAASTSVPSAVMPIAKPPMRMALPQAGGVGEPPPITPTLDVTDEA